MPKSTIYSTLKQNILYSPISQKWFSIIKLAKDASDLFLCQALHFPYGSNHDSNFDVHVYHGNSLSHNNQTFCLKLWAMAIWDLKCPDFSYHPLEGRYSCFISLTLWHRCIWVYDMLYVHQTFSSTGRYITHELSPTKLFCYCTVLIDGLGSPTFFHAWWLGRPTVKPLLPCN